MIPDSPLPPAPAPCDEYLSGACVPERDEVSFTLAFTCSACRESCGISSQSQWGGCILMKVRNPPKRIEKYTSQSETDRKRVLPLRTYYSTLAVLDFYYLFRLSSVTSSFLGAEERRPECTLERRTTCMIPRACLRKRIRARACMRAHPRAACMPTRPRALRFAPCMHIGQHA